jgi:hypothetical protein
MKLVSMVLQLSYHITGSDALLSKATSWPWFMTTGKWIYYLSPPDTIKNNAESVADHRFLRRILTFR